MKKTFYCAAHDRDESIDMYAGKISGRCYCLKSIAGARKNATARKIEARRLEALKDAEARKLKVQVVSVDSAKARAQKRKKKLAKRKRQKIEHKTNVRLMKSRRYHAAVRAYWRGEGDHP